MLTNKYTLAEYLYTNNLYALFTGKTNGDKYKVVIEKINCIDNTTIWCFGRVYELSRGIYTYMAQGCASYSTKDKAIHAACKFFGVEDTFNH